MAKRLVIAGTGSGVGKTTLTIGIMAALGKKGYRVQGFKCGPDYIDPTYHTAVTGRPSRNVDSWMTGRDAVKEIFVRASHEADISIVEGVMGMYDGKDPLSDEGSTADISRLLEAPVLLVVNVQSMARSAAAIVKGFQTLGEGANIVGVIANQAGSEGHYKLVKAAVEQECGVPVIGYMRREAEIRLPERHLGLVPSIERGDLAPFFDKLAAQVADTVDLERLWELADSPALRCDQRLFPVRAAEKRVKLAVAKDAAFHFYYPENLELLEAHGAELAFFSPLAGEPVPADADGLYIGGGFPEEFAGQLAAQAHVAASIRQFIAQGGPTLAECGGFMALTEQLVDRGGAAFPMVGVIPGRVAMQQRLAALGYREVAGAADSFLLAEGERARGHEFHYSTFQPSERADVPAAFQAQGRQGMKLEGYLTPNLVASYIHLHFASNPALAANWVRACEAYRSKRMRMSSDV